MERFAFREVSVQFRKARPPGETRAVFLTLPRAAPGAAYFPAGRFRSGSSARDPIRKKSARKRMAPFCRADRSPGSVPYPGDPAEFAASADRPRTIKSAALTAAPIRDHSARTAASIASTPAASRNLASEKIPRIRSSPTPAPNGRRRSARLFPGQQPVEVLEAGNRFLGAGSGGSADEQLQDQEECGPSHTVQGTYFTVPGK